MSLLTVNTIEVGGVETRQKIALNTEKISILDERDGKDMDIFPRSATNLAYIRSNRHK